ncbi:MAG: mechanosensitive ion channel family protein [Armatimonadota bacterium]|nr:mechanosensitive ion channel family protein [Armatimonadota bacterium]MDR7451109.1 mechanosensitive ion channel family protein [Armatimonadota bacterium]MDR7467286.1 mechanosensitive ion channel family protein [Armatimonadota bacterium]MDR7494547.1 mechanosensitive ion channel family protein [Armatimonadota bacterium]MDR7499876.1 mechanosensitive ion channel family protein [Armatimonadota bacterium]
MNPIAGRLLEHPGLLALGETLLSVVLILIGAAVVMRLATSVARRALAPRGDRLLDETRARTLRPLVESLLRYVVAFIALVMVLREVGVDIAAILASAGVVGLAVGFGAQQLIRDLISGFFILAEGLIRVGDVIVVGEHTGVVEQINVRTTLVRKYNGELWSIRNGELTLFGNLNRDFSRAIVTVGVAYEADLRRAMGVMEEVGRRWAEERKEIVLEPPEVQGVMRFGESQVEIRLVVMVRPMAHWEAERELRVRLKEAFDREGLEIPFPRRVTYLRSEGIRQ